MSRNEEPHTAEATAISAQSNGSKGAELRPSAVAGDRAAGSAATTAERAGSSLRAVASPQRR